MNITRDLIEKISKENNIETVYGLLEYIDHQEFYDLVYKKSRELENGIFKFRYNDRKEMLDNYRLELFNDMITKGRLLDKERCEISKIIESTEQISNQICVVSGNDINEKNVKVCNKCASEYEF